LFFYLQGDDALKEPGMDDLNFGSSGGGGEENANKNEPIEFGAHRATQDDPNEIVRKATVNLIRIQLYQELAPVENAQPVPEKPKTKPLIAKRTKPRKSIIAENLPIGHVRHGGRGPGSDGGTGKGSGGGIGDRIGYSIDWGGTGGRRLLSGRIPAYPSGTDKEMAVVLEFTVLPDGSVARIMPTRKTDELLEKAAVDALRTWRFEPLAPGLSQKTQSGEAKFSFTLKQTTKGELQ
jgi:TonB family protein